jgi:hypothetical protein
MNWETAKSLLVTKIRLGMHLTPEHDYKIVTEIPPYKCGNYGNDIGFRVQVGEKSFINIPMSMLEVLYNKTLQNRSTYNRTVFANEYPQQVMVKPCHVHAIGKLFEHAGVMEKTGSREYRIIHTLVS